MKKLKIVRTPQKFVTITVGPQTQLKSLLCIRHSPNTSPLHLWRPSSPISRKENPNRCEWSMSRPRPSSCSCTGCTSTRLKTAKRLESCSWLSCNITLIFGRPMPCSQATKWGPAINLPSDWQQRRTTQQFRRWEVSALCTPGQGGHAFEKACSSSVCLQQREEPYFVRSWVHGMADRIIEGFGSMLDLKVKSSC